ncbi:Detected protein of confused Function [Hibiscus syriacus]|uniref:Detected protein of confused Function n=2 Tax=Hibiscus syriacus TaxID=106335 RepID=A0A6A2Z408_HIBSY|nr:Detected protein of confused Function [Hibiscus syriacus]
MARNETRQLGTVLALDRALSERESAAEDPVRMSLMEFLQETDLIGPRHTTVNAGDDEENEEKETVAASVGMQHTCCVCMVRHRGAAFIPCGHTFCRVCSRELWVQRGDCPPCSGIIMEILDIF